ncbi:MAG: hypothetical protein Kow00105_13650 [Phycisphaeraceae bacterium]
MACCAWFVLLLLSTVLCADSRTDSTSGTLKDNSDKEHDVVCAVVHYEKDNVPVCFSNQFLVLAARDTHINVDPTLTDIRVESDALFEHPFSVITGNRSFTLDDDQVDNLRSYLLQGGFLLASAGCGSEEWNESFASTLRAMFPDIEPRPLADDHPVYDLIYDVSRSNYKLGGPKRPELWALELDGRTAVIWSPEGVNDTDTAGPGCCCCGGNEVESAGRLNVNILAYALTH